MMQKGEMKAMTMMIGENQLCRSQVHVTAFWGTEGYAPKRGLNRLPNACSGGGGWLGSHPTPNHVIGKWTVNTTLAKGHPTDLVHY